LAVLSGCEAERYEICDPLDAQCRAEVFSTVKCLRQMPDGTLPALRVITQAERRAELSRDLVQDPDEAAQTDAVERALLLLALAQPGDLTPASVADLFAETVPAYYSPDSGAITLVESEKESRDPGQLTLTLAHELAHALQDQDVGLAGVYRNTTSFDDYLASISLVEGEAEMLEGFFAAALWGFREDPDFRLRHTSWLEDAEANFEDSSPLLVSQRYFPYSYGARFVYNVFVEGGMAAVRARLADIPKSVLPILLSVEHVEEPPIESLAERSAPLALDGFELLQTDTLGPWILSKFLERGLVPAGPAELVAAWRADRFLVYASPAGSVAAVWTLRFEDAAAAERLLGALDGGRAMAPASGRAFASVSDRELTLGVVEDNLTLDAWSATTAEAQRVWREAPAAARAPVAPRFSRGLSAQLARLALRLP